MDKYLTFGALRSLRSGDMGLRGLSPYPVPASEALGGEPVEELCDADFGGFG